MKQSTVVVTGEMARGWLKSNTKNRAIRRNHVDRLKRDLIAGRWVRTHQGIAFGVDGALLDGQHRLTAIAESGVPATLVVWHGVPQEAASGMDQGGLRDGRDIMSIVDGAQVSKDERSCINNMMRGVVSRKKLSPTAQEQAEWYRLHLDAARWACTTLASKKYGLTRASVVAVVARAWYTVDRRKLGRFCEVLLTGIPVEPAEETIIVLRDYLMSLDGASGAMASLEIYRKTARALEAFLSGKKLGKLYETTKEPFPIPSSESPRLKAVG